MAGEIGALYITFGAGYLLWKETRDIITLNLPNEAGFNFALHRQTVPLLSVYSSPTLYNAIPVLSTLEKKLELKGMFHHVD